MAYPDQWAQTSQEGPYDQDPSNPDGQISWIVFNWVYTGTFDVSSWNTFQWAVDYRAWWHSWLWPIIFTKFPTSTVRGRLWLNHPGGLFHSFGPDVGGPYQAGNVLPLFSPYVLRMRGEGFSRRDRGRKFVSGIKREWVSGGRINDSGMSEIQTALSNFTIGYTSQGIDFYLVIPSYVENDITYVERVECAYRPGTIRRRRKQVGNTLFTRPVNIPPMPS